MPVPNAVKNALLAARLFSLGEHSAYTLVKVDRVSDIMQYGFAAIGLVLMASLFLVISLLIKFTSQGPIYTGGCESAKMDAFLPSINSVPCRLALKRKSAPVC